MYLSYCTSLLAETELYGLQSREKLGKLFERIRFRLFTVPCFSVRLGNSRKYPYPTTDGFHVLTPPCLRKFQNALPPVPSEFHNREPLLPFGIFRVFLEVHFRLGNVYMNKWTWIYASQRLWSSGAKWQALLFSNKKTSYRPRVARLCNPFFKSKFGYKKKPVTVIFLLFVFLCCFDVHKAK